MTSYRTREVFVPGGNPQHTYVPRTAYGLEEELRAASDNLCKLVTVTGPTKSGKSVLARRIFPPSDAVWIDGGSVAAEDDLWSEVLDQLGGYSDVTTTDSTSDGESYGGSAGVEGGIPLIGEAKAQAEVGRSRAKGSSTARGRKSSQRSTALRSLQESGQPIIIDDFHYIEKDLQGSVIRALKSPIFDGHPAVLLAIPHRRYDAIRVEREMTGRVQQIRIPEWTHSELHSIPEIGLPLLNATVADDVIGLFLKEALGSPHLVQEFFREVCISVGLLETSESRTVIVPDPSAESLLKKIAGELSRPVFDALAKGPRQRSDRIQRKFHDGRRADIYVAVLNAVAALKPGKGSLEYEEIRGQLRDLLLELPQAHEVSRVLEHMSLIQAGEGSSAPVLDWDKEARRLHITDPYFAFFLKWGADQLTGDHAD